MRSDTPLFESSDTIKSGCQEDINNNNDVVTQLDNVVNNYNVRLSQAALALRQTTDSSPERARRRLSSIQWQRHLVCAIFVKQH